MLTSKSIMLKNQFANKNSAAHGKTPSSFVTNYMARNDATLTTYPVTDADNCQIQNLLDAQNVYQKQRDLLLKRKAHYSRQKVTAKSWSNLTTLEGRGFNQNSLSLSKTGIKQTAAKLQQAFDQGHTVLEMVASFDNQYLTDLGVEKQNTPRDFHNDIDELKLRIAVQKGCQALANDLGYRQPVFAGAIQLDRDHPHAHIALAETSSQSDAKKFFDGTEYGRLSNANRQHFLSAVDDSLVQMQPLAFMPSNQVEQAQLATQNYAQNYQLLPQKHQVMLYEAAENDNPLVPTLLQDLSERPYSKKSVTQKRQDLQDDKENSTKEYDLPYLDALNLQDEQALKQTNNPAAKLMLKKRQMDQYQKRLQEKQRTLLKRYLHFRKDAINHPEQKMAIEQKILPYYVQAITNTATKLDYTGLFDFTDHSGLTVKLKQQEQELTDLKQTAVTPLAKATFKDQALKTAVNWQMHHFTDSQSVILTINSRPDDLKVPYLKLDHKLSKPTKADFDKQQVADDYENLLGAEAANALKELPASSENKLAQAELNAQALTTAKQQQEQTDMATNKPVAPVKSISYAQAEDVLIALS